MYLWRRTAEPRWVKAHEDALQAHACGQLVIIRVPGRKRLQVEIVSSSQRTSRALVAKFGGCVEHLPRNWLAQFSVADSKPITIGKHLMVSSARGIFVSGPWRHKGRSHIRISASAAFGTGEHSTTAMSLRLLEELTRRWKRGWSVVDLGTGSGILALAAKRFGAGRVVGIDNDPVAIMTAKSNARLNKIRGITFQLADVRKWRSAQNPDVITANLYGDLLIEVLPELNRSGWLILSGILRTQEIEFLRALLRNDFERIRLKRRGKWIALLACCRGLMRAPGFAPAKFLRRS